MTFNHKTVNILFHIRKFLSGKDAVNTLHERDECLLKILNQILTQTFFKKHCIYIQSVWRSLYHNTKQEWRKIWRLIYKAMTRKGL